MNEQPVMPDISTLRTSDLLLAKDNRDAAMSIVFGFGAVFSLVLTAIIGSRFTQSYPIYFFLIAAGLILSVILFFTAGKRDERWYVVCSLINHMGIGLAALMLLQILGLPMRVLNMALSFLPASAILCGVSLIMLCVEQDYRDRLLIIGIMLEILLILVFMLVYSEKKTEFWLLGAICGLICCASIGAYIWVRKDSGVRSVYKALAVVSFSIYLLLAVAAAVALFISMSSDSNDRSSRKSKSHSKSSGGGSLLSGITRSSAAGTDSSPVVRRHRYYSNSAIRYWLWYTPSGRYRSYDWMPGETEDRIMELKRREHRRAMVLLAMILIVAILVVFAAVYFGRG